MSRATTSDPRRTQTSRPTARKMAGPGSPRRGSRGQGVVASIVVVGLVAAIALLASGILRHGESGSSGPSFPAPATVPSATSAVHPSRTGRVAAWALPEALVGPRDVAVTSDGRVWITEQNRGRIDTLKDGIFTRYATDNFPYVGAFAFGTGPGDTMWFTGFPGGSIARMLPDGSANGFAPFSEGSATLAVAEGEGDAMWITDSQRGLLIRVGPDGEVSQLPVSAPAGFSNAKVQPRDIARGADGTMWFTDPGTGSVGSVGIGDQVSIVEHPMWRGAQPRSIALAPDGSLWITMTDRRALARIDPANGAATVVTLPGADATLNDLLVSPDGSIWVSEEGAFLLHVRADGSLIERVKLPDGAVYADGIAQAADGTIWAAATDANLIVSVAPRS